MTARAVCQDANEKVLRSGCLLRGGCGIMEKMPVFVYLSQLNTEPSQIFPPAREEEISSCSNERVRLQKIAVWHVLQSGLQHAYGLDIRNAAVQKTACGKWESAKCCFSLSHTDRGVAVAVSDKAVGVDREDLPNPKLTRALFERIATRAERARCGDAPTEAEIAALWTKKEALFKRDGGSVFLPQRIETAGENCATFVCGGAVISAAGNGELRVFIVERGEILPVTDVKII